MPSEQQEYSIGVMKIVVAEQADDFHLIVDEAVAGLELLLNEQRLRLSMHLHEFTGPHLVPAEGAYSPFDFLQLGLIAKVQRSFHFLLIVTEVDLSAAIHSYVVALPSQLTNIGIISTKRLSPEFWGQSGNRTVTVERLQALMLHTLGHLLNVPHEPSPDNVMHDFHDVEELAAMRELLPAQVALMRQNLPLEAREEIASDHPWRFTFRQIANNWPSIWRSVRRANPIRLLMRLPTMVTAGFSLLIVLFFTAEIWDVANSLQVAPLVLFSLISIVAATAALYRVFALRTGATRTSEVYESAVVASTATLLSLLLTMALLYLAFFTLGTVGAATFFPAELKATWPSVDPAIHLIDHVKLGMFLGAMGVLGGSLGGSAESKPLIRHVLFLDEET